MTSASRFDKWIAGESWRSRTPKYTTRKKGRSHSDSCLCFLSEELTAYLIGFFGSFSSRIAVL